MLSKFTVIACYCIYFSKTPKEYAEKFFRIAQKYRTDEDTDISIGKATKIALEMMKPDWKKKANGDNSPTETVDVSRLLRHYKRKLKTAEYEYKNAEWNGEKLSQRINRDKIREIRQQISDLESKNNVE